MQLIFLLPCPYYNITGIFDNMHLNENVIALYSEGKLPPEERRRVNSHLADCEVCSSALADVINLNEITQNLSGVKVDSKNKKAALDLVRSQDNSGFTQSIYAAAGLFAVFIITIMVITQTGNDTLRFRSALREAEQMVLFPGNGSTLNSEQLRFEWRHIDNAIAYKFILHSNDGMMIADYLTGESFFALPEEIRLEPGQKYFWRVEVIFPDNTKERSTLHVFTLKN